MKPDTKEYKIGNVIGSKEKPENKKMLKQRNSPIFYFFLFLSLSDDEKQQ